MEWEPTWKRALRDTKDAVLNSVLFWVASLITATVAAIVAVTFYPRHASPLQQAAIQGSAVVSSLLLLIIIVFLGLFVAWSPRRQRDEVRAEIQRAASREQLLAARRALGSLMVEAGHLLAYGRDDSVDWLQKTAALGKKTNELLKSTPVFDTSHVGMFWSAFTRISNKMLNSTATNDAKGERMLATQLKVLERFIDEINTQLNALPR